MRVDFGIASYQNPQKLSKTLKKMQQNSVLDWRCFVVDNASPDPGVRTVIEAAASADERIVPVFRDSNVGYAGAVNHFLELAETPFVAYLDNDAYVQSHGWDEALLSPLMKHHELAMTFPNGGAYPLRRTHYTEVLWGVGFCWMLNRQRYIEIGGMDTEIGHQEEVDFQMRLRLDGWKMAAVTSVLVKHDATSSMNPDSQKRINDGVIRWVDKWASYFGGKGLNYHSPNVIRFEDWPINALYLEEFYQKFLPDLNADPETIKIDGRDYDLIKVPRYPFLYRDRII